MSPLRVAHIISSFHPATHDGGPIKSSLGLCRGLLSQGAAVRVLTTDVDGPERLSVALDEELMREDGLRVRYCRSLTQRALSPGLLLRLRELMRWAEVVHMTGVYESHVIPCLALAKRADTPLVWSPRGSLQRWQGARRLAAKSLWEATCRQLKPPRCALHTTASAEAMSCRERLPAFPVFVIPNGVEVGAGRAQGVRSGLRLLFLGRLHPIKGIDRLLDACAQLESRGLSAWSLTIAGAGDAEYRAALETQIERLGLADRIDLPGAVAGAQKEKLFRESHLLVLPSHSENFGIVVAEALASGLAVVAGRGTPWQGLDEKRCGRWVDNTPSDLAEAIVALARTDLWAAGERGRCWMEQAFSWPQLSGQMLQAYRSVIASRPLGELSEAPGARPAKAETKVETWPKPS